MQYTIDNISEFSKKIAIIVSLGKIESQFKTQYAKLQQNADLKGFRKGKAPLETLKKLHHDKVKYEVMEKLIQESYRESITKEKLNPVGQPNIQLDKEHWAGTEELKFTAEFEIYPKLDITNYKKLKLTDKKVSLSADKLQQTLESLQKQKASNIAVTDRTLVKTGDVANIDFDGFVDDKALEGGSMQAFDLEIGSNSFIPGFEKGLIGMEVGGTKDLQLKFPSSYQKKELENKAVLFKVKLNSLKIKKLPAIDDKFAETFNFKTLKEFKEVINADLLTEAKTQNKKDLEEQLFDQLIEKNAFNLPSQLVSKQKELLIQESQKELQQKGLKSEQIKDYEKKWSAEFQKNAEKILKVSLIIQELCHQLNFKANDKAIENKLQDYAKSTGIEIKKVKAFYSTPEKKNQLAYQIEKTKLTEHLLGLAEITIK